jgi:hypothetical protein
MLPADLGLAGTDRLTAGVAGEGVDEEWGHEAGEVSAETSAIQIRQTDIESSFRLWSWLVVAGASPVLATPDRRRRLGQRDYALLLLINSRSYRDEGLHGLLAARRRHCRYDH